MNYINNLAEKYQCEPIELKQALERLKERNVILYAMSGKMGAGKDTVGDLIKGELEKQGHDVKTFSYSYPMKEEMQKMVDLVNKGLLPHELEEEMQATQEEISEFLRILGDNSVYERSDNSRLAIQYWGTGVRRKQDPNYWINKLVQLIIDEVNKGNSVFISDVRFDNEADSIINLGGKVLRLDVDEKTRIERIMKRDNLVPTQEHLNHLSETALDNYKFEITFDASQNIDKIVKQIMEYINSEVPLA